MIAGEQSNASMAPSTAAEAAAVGRYFGGFLAACYRSIDAWSGRVGSRIRSSRGVGSRHAVVASMLQRHGVSGKRVLDLGCGTGETSLAAARLGADVVGIDLVERVVVEASRKADAGGFRSRVRFHAGDVTSVPLERSDVTMLVGVIEYYSDLDGLLGRACAATRELAIVVDTRGPSWRRLLRGMVRRLERFTLVYRSPAAVAAAMAAHGFAQTEQIEGHSFVAMAFRRTGGGR